MPKLAKTGPARHRAWLSERHTPAYVSAVNVLPREPHRRDAPDDRACTKVPGV